MGSFAFMAADRASGTLDSGEYHRHEGGYGPPKGDRMATYAVVYDIQQQETYNRVHVAIRVAILFVLWILGWLLSLVYLAIPVLAAIQISQKGKDTYFAEAEQGMASWLRWLAGLFSYQLVLTDKLPNEDMTSVMRFQVTPVGDSTAGHVLLRIILAIPHAFVLGLLGIVAGLLALVAAIMVLVQEKYPQGIFDFNRGYMRWNARMYGYLAGFSDQYPPFALDTGPDTGPATALPAAPQTPPASGGAAAP